MSTLPIVSDPQREQVIVRSCALFLEDLLDADTFAAVSGITADELGTWLAAPGRVHAVDAAREAMQSSGELARLEASRNSRDLMRIAISIARNEDAAFGPRMEALKTVLKAAGADAPPDHYHERPQHVKITINLTDPAEPQKPYLVRVSEKGIVDRFDEVIEGEAMPVRQESTDE
jgi:hypothetical protein